MEVLDQEEAWVESADRSEAEREAQEEADATAADAEREAPPNSQQGPSAEEWAQYDHMEEGADSELIEDLPDDLEATAAAEAAEAEVEEELSRYPVIAPPNPSAHAVNVAALKNMFPHLNSCKQHNSKWEVQVSFHNMGTVQYTVTCKNEGCLRKEIFNSGMGINPLSEVLAALRVGHNYEHYASQKHFQGMACMASTTFEQYKCKVEEAAACVLEELLESNRRHVKAKYGRALWIQLDMRWSHRGFNADEGTLTVLECRTGLVIWRYHVVRNHTKGEEHKRAYENYEGTSRGMEGYSVDQVMQDVKACGFRIHTFIHDNDASTANRIKAQT